MNFLTKRILTSILVEKNFFFKRKDDNLETIMSRYDIYIKTTEPVLNFLSKNSNFQQIDGTLKIDEITMKIDAFIDF